MRKTFDLSTGIVLLVLLIFILLAFINSSGSASWLICFLLFLEEACGTEEGILTQKFN